MVHRDCLACPSFALRIAVYASHILFGVVTLLVQFIAYMYNLHLRIRFFDIGIMVGVFNGGVGIIGIVIAVCCLGISSDRAFRFTSSVIGVVLSVVSLGKRVGQLRFFRIFLFAHTFRHIHYPIPHIHTYICTVCSHARTHAHTHTYTKKQTHTSI